MMKLVNSILVMKHSVHEVLVIDCVFVVKHPEGSDPARLIHAALSRSTPRSEVQIDLQESAPQCAVDITRMDWSEEQMHIEAVSSWFVLDIDQCLVPAHPVRHSPSEYVLEPALTVQ